MRSSSVMWFAGTPVQRRLDFLVEDLGNSAVLVAASLVFSEVPPVVHRGELLSLGSLQRQRTRGGNSARKALSALGTGGKNARLDARTADLDAESCNEAPDGAVPQFDGNATWLPPVPGDPKDDF